MYMNLPTIQVCLPLRWHLFGALWASSQVVTLFGGSSRFHLCSRFLFSFPALFVVLVLEDVVCSRCQLTSWGCWLVLVSSFETLNKEHVLNK